MISPSPAIESPSLTPNAQRLTPSSLTHLPELDAFADRYATLPLQPLLILCHLVPNAPVADYDPPFLDGLLARAVVAEATQGALLPNASRPYAIPLPLRCLWRDDRDLPLWAATIMAPTGDPQRGEVASDSLYWHKRAQSGRFTRYGNGKPFPLKTVAGRWMERRVPVPVRIGHTWTALCEGNPEEIKWLLTTHIAFLGKNSRIGFGEVKRWDILPFPQLLTPNALFLDADCRLIRPLPLGARHLIRGFTPDGAVSRIGWTPPHWLPSTFTPGWRAGTRCTPALDAAT
jgi:CRISPR type IV-associated protein Csf3